MSRFIDEADRSQGTLLPETIDEYVAEENPVRVIEAFVEALDLASLGFAGVEPKATGRPAYHPATMLKIYLYGYLNRIQSTRRLEQEARRNLELMWLVGRLAPDFKTLADFRAENTVAIKNVCREFIVLCRRWKLFTEATVAIDGSKFKAVNHRDRNFTSGKMKTRMALIEQSIAEYLMHLDRMDRKETPRNPRKTARLKERIATLKDEMARLEGLKRQMEASPDGQVSLTDPDARSMASQGKGTGIVGYNVQTAVDTKHHLIVAHEVTNVGSDRAQLVKMAERRARRWAQGAHGDRRSRLLQQRADQGLRRRRHRAGGAEADHLEQRGRGSLREMRLHLPAEARCLPVPGRRVCDPPVRERENGMMIHKYWSSACPRCALRAKVHDR